MRYPIAVVALGFWLLGAFGASTTARSADSAETSGLPSAIVMSSGARGGGYWSAAARLKAVAAERGLQIEVLESLGSLHNLQQLDAGDTPVNLTLTQADALQYYLDQHPGLAAQVDILENIGRECVFMISGRESGIRTMADLEKGRRIAIASPRSGVAVTFDYMKTLVPELADAGVVYTDTLAELDRLQAGSPAADAVMVVHRPKERSAELDRALAQPEVFQMVEISDERFASRLPNGDAVYSALNLALPAGGEGAPGSLETICMKGLLLLNKEKMARDQRYQLRDLINFHWMQVYVPGG